MSLNPEALKFLLLAPPILIALTLHELAHGWVAWKLGDPTARNQGRLTLNPLKHLDPIGTLMLFIVHFGWAKPVPVNPSYFNDPKRDMLFVAAAGPMANFIVAAVSAYLMRFVVPEGYGVILWEMLRFSLIINVSLAVFNLLPIPPLDGSKIVGSLLPDSMDAAFRQFERKGWLILIGVIIIGRMTGHSGTAAPGDCGWNPRRPGDCIPPKCG